MKNLKLQSKMQKFCLSTCVFSLLLFAFLCHVSFNFSPALAQDATESSDSVRDKVRKTIENLTKKPKAVVGSLDSISDSTLKIKTEEGKLVLVATNGKTTYSKTTKGKAQDVKFTDLAIGDFVAALGYKNGNDIIDSKRVLAFDETPYHKKQAVYGEITQVSTQMLTIKRPNKEIWTIEISRNTKFKSKNKDLKVGDVEEGDRIVVAGELNLKKDKTIVASKVYIIPSQLGASPRATVKPSPKPSSSPTTNP